MDGSSKVGWFHKFTTCRSIFHTSRVLNKSASKTLLPLLRWSSSQGPEISWEWAMSTKQSWHRVRNSLWRPLFGEQQQFEAIDNVFHVTHLNVHFSNRHLSVLHYNNSFKKRHHLHGIDTHIGQAASNPQCSALLHERSKWLYLRRKYRLGRQNWRMVRFSGNKENMTLENMLDEFQ